MSAEALPATMRAWQMIAYGGPDAARMRDIARPEPAAGEALVRVRAAGLNPVDYKTREGQLKVIQRYPLPATMGNELAGEIVALGADDCDFAIGDRVFARMPKDAMGALAEYAVVPANLLARMPDDCDFTTAAGVPLAGLTALQALRDELAIGPGSRVFISAGAGGVGTFAIQIAKWLGAEVTTTASPRGRELVDRMGADRVIDYTTEDFTEILSGMDGAFDLIGGDTLERTFRIVKPGGRVVSIAALPEPRTATKDLGRGWPLAALFWFASFGLRRKATRHGVDYRFLFMHPSGSELAELAALMGSGRLVPVIDRVFPFSETAQAFGYLEEGHAKGKVVVEMPD